MIHFLLIFNIALSDKFCYVRYYMVCVFGCRSNIVTDIINGGFVVICSLCVFISLVWLREQLVHGGVPAWIQNDDQPAHPAAPPVSLYFD